MRTGDEEARSPKYAQIERERRWLIDPAANLRLPAAHVLIEDRYLIDTRIRLRRMIDSDSGFVALKLTKKYDAVDPLVRPIVTAYLTTAEHALFSSLPAANLTKRRYKLPAGDATWSIDRFDHSLEPLVLAEIEWPDDAVLRDLPSPPGAVREVSHDPRYQGGSLAINGLPGE
jgi:CYTH domain-containing protein